ncbi:hypothetical protein DVK02_05080 [Halobellus sp. Atlit-31R]|nr:hypothetical protein DVK02_05080 [Halobellus sp. Atlit-31R]
MTDHAARLVAVALVFAAVVGGVGMATPSASAQPIATIAGSELSPDDVSMRIDLRPNGTAAWTIEYRVRLDDENTTEAFLSLREDVRASESQYAAEFGQRMASTAAAAENATGREMRVRNVSVDATRQQLPQDYGVVTYSFVWTNFAAVDDGTIRAGDALAGLFLDSETSLQFTWPEGYALDTAQPEPDDVRRDSRIAVWSGPLDFGPNEPTLAVTEQFADAGEGAASATSTPMPAGVDSSGGQPLLYGVLAVVALALGAGGLFVYRRRTAPDPRESVAGGAGGSVSAANGGRVSDAGEDLSADPAETSEEGTAADADAAGGAAGGASAARTSDSTAADEPAQPDAEAGDELAAERSDEGTGAQQDAADDTMPWEDELLSNEERVLALVEHEGGRIKQQAVAQTLDWTDAKTSQVVRKMRDEGELDGFRLGRENVLVLPGEDLSPDSE